TFAIPFTAGDGQASTTQTTTFTVLPVNAAPTFPDLIDWQVSEGQEVRFRAFALDPNNPGYVPPDRDYSDNLQPSDAVPATVTVTVNGRPTLATFDPQTWIFDWKTSNADAGPHTVSFTATKGGGTGSPLTTPRDVHILVRNVNRSPHLAFIDNRVIVPGAGTSLQVPVSATDPDNDSLT